MRKVVGRGLLLLAALAWPCVAAPARADGPAPEPPPPSAASAGADTSDAPGRWYGGPMLISDAAAAGLVAGGLAVAGHNNASVGWGIAAVGAGVYALGGPIVHWSTDRKGRAAASLGLRAGAPVVGMVAGFLVGAVAFSGCDKSMCQLGYGAAGAVVGIGAGMLAAAVIDDFLLARRKPAPSKPVAVAVAPTYQPETRQTSLLLYGTW